ncbi:MliC family protein [Pleurocapsa sp. FMAR1]|uniref:MliC family protein n=1 Tax=Pleurocapsa sp. FMAR1 TaxID=3040204 RepID=UPI0029C8EBCB|nr:MliC family protein [Pleurocapsa sp. FMAR1]
MLLNLKTIFLIVLALIISCDTSFSKASADRSVEAARTIVYECDEYKFSTHTSPGKVTLYLPELTVVLDQIRAASGAKYQNKDVLFWNKDDSALLKVKDKTWNSCHS